MLTRRTKIESMRALDPLTLEITMKEGGYASLYALTFPIMEGGQPGGHPGGDGAVHAGKLERGASPAGGQ